MKFYYCLLFVILLNIVFSQNQNKVIKFKFEIYPINIESTSYTKIFGAYNTATNKVLSLNDLLFRLFTDDYYFNLTLGTPSQIIPTLWNMDKYSYKFYNGSFNQNLSSSFRNISSKFRYNFDELDYAIMCEDNFYFEDENNNTLSSKLSFMQLENSEQNYSFVGLQVPDYIEDELYTFPRALKEYEIINKYVFFIYYNKNQNNNDIMNYNGDIYFGDYPHNIKDFSDEFNENDFIEIRGSYRQRLIYWDILFDNIYFSENELNSKINYKQAEIMGNLKLSVGTDEYKDFITKNFFDKYINESICELKIILNNSDYEYFVCKNDKNLDLSKFPVLSFELKEINFNFSFNYKDLFFVHNNSIYFGIIFDRFFKLKFQKSWKLGSVLFKKYLLTFNQDSKMIGIYKKIINNNIIVDDNDNNNDKDNKHIGNKSFNIFIIIGIAILFLILIILIFIFVYKYNNICDKKHDSKNNNYHKTNVAYDSKNKNITHEYYELEDNLIN